MSFISSIIRGTGRYVLIRPGRVIQFSLLLMGLIICLPFLIMVFPWPANLVLCLTLLFLISLQLSRGIKQVLNCSQEAGLKTGNSSIIGAACILLLFALVMLEIKTIQNHILFGYKAVSNDMKPSLIKGDHYFADKILYTLKRPDRGDIFVYRDARDDIGVKRVVGIPEETIITGDGAIVLGKNQYALQNNNKITEGIKRVEIIQGEQFVAKAFMNYWTYDADASRILWERIGKEIK